jgi:Kef-type K+ transport system membrane component KefB
VHVKDHVAFHRRSASSAPASSTRFGLEAILGTFLAGMLLKLADRDDAMTHTHFHEKLAEAGLGFFVPVFFVASGLRESTTLSFVLIASQIGQELGLLSASDTAALTAAALVSVLVSPVLALAVLGVSDEEPSDALATASP